MLKPDPFLLALIATVLVASFLPARGQAVPAFHVLTVLVIGIMFFMQGARLSRAAILAGLGHWRLHLAILGCTFGLFPLLGLGLRALLPGLLTPTLWLGVLFVCVLPSTVQSAIAFTSIARGNIPAAVCAATASNLFGIAITPLLTGLVLAGAAHGGGVSAGGVLDIVLQLLLPFLAGQMLQPWIGAWALRNRRVLSFTDRGSVLIVVYTAFSEAVVQGLWHKVPATQLGLVLLVDGVLLATVLLLTRAGARVAGFAREDEIAIVFCGSKKTLASGVPMAGVLFPAAIVGQIVLPLMIFHQLQLFVCAVLARRYSNERPGALPLDPAKG